MKKSELAEIEKTFFGYLDISRVLGISPDSTRVVAHRFARKDILARIKPNLFMLVEKWKRSNAEICYKIANYIQVPSYISLTMALEYQGIATRMQKDYIESICTTRTLNRLIRDVTFRYTKLRPALYFGFKNGMIFIWRFRKKRFWMRSILIHSAAIRLMSRHWIKFRQAN